jgi:TRAP-type C4-dicarboxylate transport system permease small subunit
MTRVLNALRTANTLVAKTVNILAVIIMAVIVTALTASAVTRYVSGTGYDWLIELPPALVPWLVFPLLGPLFRSGDHIQVDLVPALLSERHRQILRLVTSIIALVAAVIFLIAGTEAVSLFRSLGQMMELEIEIPIWTMYLAFPTGFAILVSFALEALLESVQALRGKAVAESPP